MVKTFHFIGIKGSGMSALALMLHQMGYKVQGSDVDKYYFTQHGLEKAGIPILPFDAANISEDLELIAGNAFREDNNAELAYAIQQRIPFKRYHEFLGDFMRQFTSLGVAGAHGKTSTTGLLAHVLKNITDTSYLIGDGSGRGLANSQYFVFESDEYERHFMPYHPEYSIITNIDFDHPDYFTSVDDVFDAFNDYAKQVQKALFVYGEDPYLRKITATAPIYYYGFEANDDFQACDILR
ncbi:Mur ligase domain-containing protein, partial [Jeotgalibaca porci]